jgi:hypothetical protein
VDLLKEIKMKKLLAILAMAFFLALPFVAHADPPATMGWDANTEPDLAGYRIYFTLTPGEYVFGGASSQNFLVEIPCGPNDASCCIYNKPNLTGAGYYFVATAFDTDGFESLPSNEINSLPPGQTKNLKWVK